MRRFVGGNDGRVFVINPGVRELGVFEWGVMPCSHSCIDLAKTLLMELLNNPQRVTALYMRFMHRTVAVWKEGQAWTFADVELMSIVKDIEQTERDAAHLRQQMAREQPIIQPAGPQFPGDTGYGRHDSAPDRRRK